MFYTHRITIEPGLITQQSFLWSAAAIKHNVDSPDKKLALSCSATRYPFPIFAKSIFYHVTIHLVEQLIHPEFDVIDTVN
jgi:hypothetical protein